MAIDHPEIGDRSLLERCLRAVTDVGINRLVIVVGYRGDAVVETIGYLFEGVPMSYAIQHDRYGLAHAVCRTFEDAYDSSSIDATTSIVPSETAADEGDTPSVRRNRTRWLAPERECACRHRSRP